LCNIVGTTKKEGKRRERVAINPDTFRITMANVVIRQRFVVCGMENGPVIHISRQTAVNPAPQFVASTRINDPAELLNVSVNNVLNMIKDHHRCEVHIVPVSMVIIIIIIIIIAKYLKSYLFK
jgi:hypothetical protein